MEALTISSVVGPAIGALIAIIGICVQSILQTKARQAEERWKLKTNILLAAVSHFSEVKVAIMKTASKPSADLEFFGDASIVGKVTTVASNKTIQAITSYNAELSKLFLPLVEKSLPIKNLAAAIENLTKLHDQESSSIAKILAEMQAYNLRGHDDPHYFERLQQQYKHHEGTAHYLNSERDKKWEKHNALALALTSEGVTALASLAEFEVAAVSAIRTELEMDFDEQSYRRSLNELNSDLERQFQGFLNRLPAAVQNA